MARWPRGSHGGTYGGNPIGCAAALATIDVLTEPGFLDGVAARGRQLTDGLAEMAAGDPGVAEVRALGPHGGGGVPPTPRRDAPTLPGWPPSSATACRRATSS